MADAFEWICDKGLFTDWYYSKQEIDDYAKAKGFRVPEPIQFECDMK